MKEKIKARLKAKFSGVNLSQTRMDAIADKLAKRLTDTSEESEIDEALDDLNEIYSFSDIAKSDDRARTEAKKKAQDPPKKEDDDEPKDDPAVPAWAKGLIEANKSLTEKLSALESGKTLESRKSILQSKLKDAPEKVRNTYLTAFDRMRFENDEDFTGYIGTVETQVTELTQELSNNSLKGFGKTKVAGGDGKTEVAKEQVQSVVKDLMKN